jgi:hypothetical protein
MHVYLAPLLIEQYAEENFPSSATPAIDPLFAVHDPWLRSYFMLLQSECETFAGDSGHPDALLLTQSMELLIRHLVRWHSNLSRKGRRRATAGAAPYRSRRSRDIPASKARRGSPTSSRSTLACRPASSEPGPTELKGVCT